MTATGGSSSGSGGFGSAPSVIGRVIGDYRVLRQVGRGGMGTVYEAHQISLERVVALKVLSTTDSLPEPTIVRFRREAQAAAKLNHPHIVPIYAQGEEDGVHYYAMEFVRGQTVYQKIAAARDRAEHSQATTRITTPLSEDVAEETVVLNAAASVTSGGRASGDGQSGASSHETASWAMHARRSLLASRTHRTAEDFEAIGREMANVADALEYAHRNGVIHRDVKPHNLIIGEDGKIRVSDFGLARVLEQPGLTVTGEFLGSPLYMSPEQISRGDVVIDHRTDIYSLGATLYEWLTLVPPFPGDSREHVITQILTADVISPRAFDPRIPVDLETICLKALEKSVTHRYGSAGEMRDDLQRFLAGRAIKARRAGAVTRARRFVARHAVATMGLLTAAIVLSLGTAVYQQSRAHKAETKDSAAAVQEQAAKIAEVEQRNEELKTLIEAVAPLGWNVIQQSVGTGEGEAQEALQTLSNRFSTSYLSDYLDRERERLQAESPAVAAGSILEFYLSALSALASGNMPAARAVLDDALEIEPNDAGALHLRALVHCRRGDWQGMKEDAETLMAAHPQDPSGFFLRGAALLFDDAPLSAVRDLERALEAGADEPWLHTLAGSAYLRLEEYAGAHEAFDRALAQAPQLTAALFGRARCSYQNRVYSQAIADATAVIEADPQFGDAYVLRADALNKLERFDEALSDYARAAQFKRGSSTLAYKIWLAQANKQRASQAEDLGESAAKPERPAVDQQDDFFHRFLQEQLQSDAGPRGVPRPRNSDASRLG